MRFHWGPAVFDDPELRAYAAEDSFVDHYLEGRR